MPYNSTQQKLPDNGARYLRAKKQLESLLEQQSLNNTQRECSQKLISHIEQLKQKEHLSLVDAAQLLDDTAALLSNNLSPEAYRQKAQNVQGHPSVAMKIVGALMITLGSLIAGVCIVIAATTGLTLSGEGLTGAGILAAGIGLFSGGVRSGLSQEMCDLANSSPTI